ncbi:alcohol dehydrogenase (NADP(+)) [Ranunculus cassubicifolius]
MERKTSTVCVTGGGGYIGSWLVMRLLERGYNVRATVRLDPENKRDISHLTNLPGASDRLKIFNADLTKPETFIRPIEGCDGVFHVAHPTHYDAVEADSSMINMTVEGVLGILKACVNSKTVKRFVYTSSIAAVMYNKSSAREWDENVWTDVDLCKTAKLPGSSYCIPKTLAEQAALRFAEENEMEVVSIVPSLVVGPFICTHFPSSVYLALALIMGRSDRYSYLTRPQMVHVDDIVSAHIYLLECPDAKGRYICSSHKTTLHELIKFLANRYQEFKMPMELLKDMEEIKPFQLTSKKLLDLGFVFKNGLEEMYDGAIQSCREKGFL